jgi:hypothetical protein
MIQVPIDTLQFGGVEVTEPDSPFKQKIDRSISEYVKSHGKKDGLYTVTMFQGGKIGTNFVVVKNVGSKASIEGYIGKIWGEPIEGGIKGVWLF